MEGYGPGPSDNNVAIAINSFSQAGPEAQTLAQRLSSAANAGAVQAAMQSAQTFCQARS